MDCGLSHIDRWQAKKARAMQRRKELAHSAGLRVLAPEPRRTSSAFGGYRVTQPPGGASSFSFGDQPPRAASAGYHDALAAQISERVVAQQQQQQRQFVHIPRALSRRPECDAPPSISSNVWANGANQNCGNFITGRPTSRVLNPPGGKTSIVFG